MYICSIGITEGTGFVAFDTTHGSLDEAKAFAEKVLTSSVVGGWACPVSWFEEKHGTDIGLEWAAYTYSLECDPDGCPLKEVQAIIQRC